MSFIDTLHLEQLLPRCVSYQDVCSTLWNVLFIIEQVVRNDSWNSIHNIGEHNTKWIRLSEKNIDHECVEENTNSLCCSAEEETSENGNKWDSLESSDSDGNSDSDFEQSCE